MKPILSEKAKVWSSVVAKEVKCMPPSSTDSYLLYGRTLLTKDEFDRFNDEGFAAVHGIQVAYGPFSSKKAMEEFVTDYPEEFWPGPDEWRYWKIGDAEVISSYTRPEDMTVVHSKSLPFQGQLSINEMKRKIQEQEEVQAAVNKRLEEPQKLSQKEIAIHIEWQKGRIDVAKKELQELEDQLNRLYSIKVDDTDNQ